MSWWAMLYADGEAVYRDRMDVVDMLPHTHRPLGEVPPEHVLEILAAPYKAVIIPRLHARTRAFQEAAAFARAVLNDPTNDPTPHKQATAPTVPVPAEHDTPRPDPTMDIWLNRPTTRIVGSDGTGSPTPNT